MRTKEVAEVLGTTSNVITENGKKLFPDKDIQPGKAVDWTEEEVTILIDHMQKNPSNNAGKELISSTYRSGLTTWRIKLRTKEVAEICGVTEECIRQNAKKVGMDFGYGEFTNHDWTEEELKRIQVQLMKNSNNQGNANELVKSNSKAALELGALTLAANASVDATKQLCELLMQKALETQQLQLAEAKTKELEAKNQLLIEQKEAAEAETERIHQYNKNFHENLYTASELAKMLGTTANRIGRIANEHCLKQDPLYGKLGKIQLNNGRWCNIFYYNNDAKTVIENNL